MRILLTNDDGIYAPGLAAMERSLRRLGDVFVVAPAREQSGVAHSITFLTPLLARQVFVNDKPWGWTVDGSPADCVKLGITALLPERPDLVISGMNGGLNTGINVLYSGTVGAAVEGAFYGITSIAVSLQFQENEPYDRAADLATGVLEKMIRQDGLSGQLYNLNIPLKALEQDTPAVAIVPMDVSQYWETFERRTDPSGRAYYWLSGRPDPRSPKRKMPEQMTDLKAIAQGFITVTPLNYDVSDRQQLLTMSGWDLTPEMDESPTVQVHTGPQVRVSWQR